MRSTTRRWLGAAGLLVAIVAWGGLSVQVAQTQRPQVTKGGVAKRFLPLQVRKRTLSYNEAARIERAKYNELIDRNELIRPSSHPTHARADFHHCLQFLHRRPSGVASPLPGAPPAFEGRWQDEWQDERVRSG